MNIFRNLKMLGGNAQPVVLAGPMDKAKFGIVTTNHVQAEALDGDLYFCEYRTPSKLANDAAYMMLMSTGSNGGHVTIETSGEGTWFIDGFSGPTVTDAGTLLSVVNYDMSLPDSSGMLIYHTPTISNDGAQVMWDMAPGGKGARAGGSMPTTTFFTVPPNERFLLRATNKSGVTAYCRTIFNISIRR